MVQIPGDDRPPTKLSKISGEIYPDMQLAKTALMSRAEKAIDEMLKKGQLLIDNHSNTEDPDPVSPEPEEINNTDDFDGEFVTLPDGTRAKVNFKGEI